MEIIFTPHFVSGIFGEEDRKWNVLLYIAITFANKKMFICPHQLGISNYHTLSSFVYTFICIEMYCSQLSLVMVQYADNLKHFSSLFVLRFLDIQ